jgi:hypothetical protein
MLQFRITHCRPSNRCSPRFCLSQNQNFVVRKSAFRSEKSVKAQYVALVDPSATFADEHEAELTATLRRRTDGGGRQIGDRMNKWFEWMLAFVSDEQAALFDVFLTPLLWVRINAVHERLHYVDVGALPFRFVPCGDEHEPFVRGATGGQSEHVQS